MEISKVLNNNVAVVIENNEEKIVMGLVICFKKKTGDTIEPKIIDKVFYLQNQEVLSRFKELVVDIPLEYLEIGEEIMDEAIKHSQKANVKHLARRVFGKSTDSSDRIILKEEDFKI